MILSRQWLRRYISGAILLLILLLAGISRSCWQQHQIQRQQIDQLVTELKKVVILRRQYPGRALLQRQILQYQSFHQPASEFYQWLQHNLTHITAWRQEPQLNQIQLTLTWSEFLQLIEQLDNAGNSLASLQFVLKAQGQQLDMKLWIKANDKDLH